MGSMTLVSAQFHTVGLNQQCFVIKDDWRVYLVVMIVFVSLATVFILYTHITIIAHNHAQRIAAENEAGKDESPPSSS